MSKSRLDDLYDRLTSRKLWLCLVAVAFALWNYHLGALSAVEFQTAITAAISAYFLAEGAVDVATAVKGGNAAKDIVDEIERRMDAAKKSDQIPNKSVKTVVGT